MSYQNIKDRLYHGHRKIANNTYLLRNQYGEEQIDMELHGNLVARFHPDYLQLYSAGWHTTTTKDRLNLALELAGITNYKDYTGLPRFHARIFQKNYQWYYMIDIIPPVRFYGGMKIDYTGRVIN